MYVLWIVVCPVLSSLIYGFWLPLLSLQTLLVREYPDERYMIMGAFCYLLIFLSCPHECTDSWNIAHLEYKTFSWNTFVSFNILNIVYFYRNKYCNEKGKRTITLKKCCCSFASVACSLLLPGARYSQPRGSHLLPKEAAWVLCVQWLACCSPRMW
jgi:hypothetical protein